MGISLEFWKELEEVLTPYVSRVRNGEMTFSELEVIYEQKYQEFVEKYTDKI